MTDYFIPRSRNNLSKFQIPGISENFFKKFFQKFFQKFSLFSGKLKIGNPIKHCCCWML